MFEDLIKGEIAKTKGRQFARWEFDKKPFPLDYKESEARDIAEVQTPDHIAQFMIGYREERTALTKVYNRGLRDGRD